MQRSYTRRQLLVLLLAAVLIVAAALTFSSGAECGSR